MLVTGEMVEAPDAPDTDASAPGTTASTPRTWAPVVLGALMLLTFVLSLVVARGLFPLYSVNHDEAMYVYGAQLLADGNLTLPADEHEVFRPWASGVRGDRIVMKYPPPWPAVLAVGEAATGSYLVGPAAMAAAAVGLVYLLAREVWRDRRSVALIAAGVFALSPITLLQGGTFLPYLFQLVTGLVFAVCLLAGRRRGSPRLLALGGAAFGLGLFARPFDIVMFALPFVVVLAWTLRDRRAELARTLGFVAAGAAPVVALDLLYNAQTMGNPLSLPYTVTGPYDTVGFGERGIFANRTLQFTFTNGLEGLGLNLRWFPSWSFGGIVTFVLAGLALVVALRSKGAVPQTREIEGPDGSNGRGNPWPWAVAGVALTVCVGYIFFWGPYAMSDRWPGVELLGPFYHLAVLVPVVLLGAYGFDVLWRGTDRQRLLAVAAAGVGLVLTVVAVPDKIEANAEIRDELEITERQVDALHLSNAVMVLPSRGSDGFRSPVPFLENRPDLDQPVLYAEDRGARNITLFDRYGDRDIVHLAQQHQPDDELLDPSLVPIRLRLEGAQVVGLDLTFTNTTGEQQVIAYVDDGRTRQEHRLDDTSQQGDTYSVSWDLAADRQALASALAPTGAMGPVGPEGPVAGEGDFDVANVDRVGYGFTPRRNDAGVLTVGFAVGDDGDEVTDTDLRWERRYPYRIVDGELQLVRPGRGYELFSYGGERHWITRNVDEILVEADQP